LTSDAKDGRIPHEPRATPSVLASIPDCLKSTLIDSADTEKGKRRSVLVSSNSLANKFIFTRWGIRPSQRRRYRNLFTAIRKHCRVLFQHYLLRGRLQWNEASDEMIFGVYKYDEIRGNLILGFVHLDPNSAWTLPFREAQ